MLYVMLVGAYPFERPEDKHDNQKLQKMIQVSAAMHSKRFRVSECRAPRFDVRDTGELRSVDLSISIWALPVLCAMRHVLCCDHA